MLRRSFPFFSPALVALGAVLASPFMGRAEEAPPTTRTLSARILSCTRVQPCAANDICRVEVHVSAWDFPEGKSPLPSIVIWDQGPSRDTEADWSLQDRISFPAQLVISGDHRDEFTVTTLADHPPPSTLIVKGLAVGESRPATLKYKHKKEEMSFSCRRYKDVK